MKQSLSNAFHIFLSDVLLYNCILICRSCKNKSFKFWRECFCLIYFIVNFYLGQLSISVIILTFTLNTTIANVFFHISIYVNPMLGLTLSTMLLNAIGAVSDFSP